MVQSHENDYFDFFRSMQLFQYLNDEELEQIMVMSCRETYETGDYVFSENDPGRKLYIVYEGKLALELAGKTVSDFEKGELFGEIALINGSIRSGSVRSLTPSTLFCLNGEDLFDNSKVPPETALKFFRELAVKVTSYLRPIDLTTTRELINQGEGEHVEFKSTLRLNLHTRKNDREIEHAVLKTVAAFLNAEGGTLLIGVNDAGELLDLQNDKFPNDDRMLLHFTKLVNDRIGMQHMSYVDCYVDPVEGKKVLRIDIRPANIPAYLEHHGDEYFYLRTGPSTSSLRISEHYDYVKNRFG